jgi:hypothetical protein
MSGELFEVRAALMYNGEEIVAFNRGYTMFNARKNLIKSLCNKLRSRIEDGSFWTEWPDLSSKERDDWASRVNDMLVWIDVDENASKLDSESFWGAFRRGWA